MTYDHITAYLTESRLSELLERNNMTREELATLSDIPDETIAAIESGNYDPPLSFAYKLAAALEIPVEGLFSD